MTAADVAGMFIRRGWSPVPVPHRKKRPALDGWPELRITASNIGQYFNGAPQNVGVVLGEHSSGLVDVDLDCEEAIAVAADLLSTTLKFGRASRRASHWVYQLNGDAGRRATWKDPLRDDEAKAMLVELRANGCQTVFPGSVHETGEYVEWDNPGAAVAETTRAEVQSVVARVAAAALLVRYWPKGARHDAVLALAGSLANAGWTEADAHQLVGAVVRAACDDEPDDRTRAVHDTFAKRADGQRVLGIRGLADHFDQRIVNKLAEWLNLRRLEPVDNYDRAERAAISDEPPPDDRPWPGARRETADPQIVILDGPAIAAPLPDFEYLVAEIGLVAGGGAPHIVAGYGYAGKTVSLQAMLVSLASGTPVWGAYAVRPRRVRHVDKEQGDSLTRRRYQRLAKAAGVDLAGLGDAIGAAIMPPLTLTSGCADLWRRIMDGTDLVLVDSMRAASPGQDENSSDIRAGLDMLGEISNETGCRALVIHHARKPSEDAPGGRFSIRGSSAIFDALDCAYVFAADKGEPIKVTHEKARSNGDTVDDFALLVSDVPRDDDPRWGLKVEVRGAELIAQRRDERAAASLKERTRRDAETVRKALRERPGLGTRELRTATTLSGDRLAFAIAHLGEAVEVRQEKRGRGVVNRHYLRGAA